MSTRAANRPQLEVSFDDFAFRIALYPAEAPVSSDYILAAVAAGVYTGTSIFRIVNLNNQPAGRATNIEVIQMGRRETNPHIPPTIHHETTRETGLRHRQGTVSLARFAPGAVYHSFFVCMRDEPVLDAGGLRHADGLGFAAFGQVEVGFEHLQRVFREHEHGPEYLLTPIALRGVRRVG